MKEYAICYVSNVHKDLDINEIKSLLSSWKERNNRNEIKGILLYSEGNFFQVLEGEKKKVLELWKSIKQDSRHYGIIQILGRELNQGSYDHFKADILSEDQKHSPGLPPAYLEPLKGMNKDIQRIIERMMENFIATR